MLYTGLHDETMVDAMIKRGMRAVLLRWSLDDDAPPEVHLHKRDLRALLAALDAADALREALTLFAYPTVAGDTFLVHGSDVNQARIALARYDALVEKP